MQANPYFAENVITYLVFNRLRRNNSTPRYLSATKMIRPPLRGRPRLAEIHDELDVLDRTIEEMQ